MSAQWESVTTLAAASAEKEYWVLAMQMGSPAKPILVYSSICFSACGRYSTLAAPYVSLAMASIFSCEPSWQVCHNPAGVQLAPSSMQRPPWRTAQSASLSGAGSYAGRAIRLPGNSRYSLLRHRSGKPVSCACKSLDVLLHACSDMPGRLCLSLPCGVVGTPAWRLACLTSVAPAKRPFKNIAHDTNMHVSRLLSLQQSPQPHPAGLWDIAASHMFAIRSCWQESQIL